MIVLHLFSTAYAYMIFLNDSRVPLVFIDQNFVASCEVLMNVEGNYYSSHVDSFFVVMFLQTKLRYFYYT